MNFSLQTSQGLGLGNGPQITAWWCPACSIMVSQRKNPVECTECEGDMTIAPERFQHQSPRIKDDAS